MLSPYTREITTKLYQSDKYDEINQQAKLIRKLHAIARTTRYNDMIIF